MKLTLLYLLIFLYLPIRASSETIYLSIGESFTLLSPPPGTVYLNQSGVLKVKEIAPHLLVVGKKIGESNLRIGSREWSFQVVPKKLRAAQLRLKPQIDKMRGLSLKIHDQCYIKGELLRWKDWRQISQLQNRESEVCLFSAKVIPQKVSFVEQQLQLLAHRSHLPPPQVDLFSGEVLISEEAKKWKVDYQKIYRPLGLIIRTTHSRIEQKPLVAVQLFIVEASKVFTKSLGLHWSFQPRAQLLPEKSIEGELGVQLEALEAEGLTRVLAAPTLVSRSGGSADFFAGGEIPFRTSGYRKKAELIWKKYGILFKIKPTADWQGRLNLNLQTEISSIDTSVSIENLPGFKTNRLESEFDLISDQAIVLSGLVQTQSGEINEGLPGLMRIPVLGRLFSSEQFTQKRSELLVFVKPSLQVAKNNSLPKTNFELLSPPQTTDTSFE